MPQSSHRMLFVSLLALLAYLCPVESLDNGLARTPPMGWLSWERFECSLDCDVDPDNCIGERLLRRMADKMVSEGCHAVGYEYITVDDCWLANERDPSGKLQPDPKRFPSGMKHLADYIHSKGLKLGVYEDVGRNTCAGFPGTIGHYQLDAQTFADWGVDMLKFDGCNADVKDFNYGYPAMSHFLNKTGRPILLSCEWALYMRALGAKPNYTAVAETCNTFRVYGDIYDSFQSIRSIIGWYGDDEGNFSSVAAPGSFNDPDMITLGDYGLSHDEERIQMGMWSMFAAPLFMSVDLSTVGPASKALLQHKALLSIDQDPLGIQGKRILTRYNKQFQVWVRPVTPVGSYAVAALYIKRMGYPIHVTLALRDIGLTAPRGYNVTEVFDGKHLGHFIPSNNFTYIVNPSGIYMYRATKL